MKNRLCPKCHKHYTDYSTIGRADNKIEICPECGQIEALEDFWKWRVK